MRRILILLALADTVLVIYLALALAHRPDAAQRSIPPVSPAVDTGASPTGPTAWARRRSKRPTDQDFPTNKLNWRLTSLPTLHECVANLREVGCPEATIQDIIVAEVNRRFAPRERSLKLKYEDYELWEAPSQGTRSVLEGQSQLAGLYNEKRALLKDLLGVEIPLELPKALADKPQPQFEAALAGLPEAKRAQIRSIQESYLAGIQKLKASTLNFLEPADIEELGRIKSERRRALAQVLTADELLDFDIKTSSLTATLQGSLRTAQVSEAEFREMFKRIQQKYDEAALSQTAGDPSSVLASLGKLREGIRTGDDIRNVLGDQRFTEMQQARDPIYQRLRQAADGSGLSTDAVEKAYSLQRAARQELASQMANPNLTNEERQRAVREYSEKITSNLREVLGEEGYRKFLEGPPASTSQPGVPIR